MTKKTIKIGIIGLGWVSQHRHIPTLKRDARFEIVGVADRHPALAAECARRFGIPRHCGASSVAEIDWLTNVDALDVVTSPMSHAALIGDALRAGKHVITEKPFTMSVAEGAQLVELAARTQQQLCIVHNFQFASSCMALKRDMARGRLGTLRSVVATQWGNPMRRLPTWYQCLPAGLFYDESPHLLYLLRALAPGELTLDTVHSIASTTGNTTPASIDAHYSCLSAHGRLPVSLSLRFEAPVSEWHVAVMGDQGVGIVDIFRNIYLYLPNDRAHTTLTVLRTSWWATWQHWLAHVVNGPKHLTGRLLYGNPEIFNQFAQAVLNGKTAQGNSAADALAVLKMQHAIIQRLS